MKRALRILLVLLVGVVIGGGWLAWRHLTLVNEPFRGFAAAEQFVEIAPGTGPQAIGRLLVDAGVVPDTLTWRIAVARSGAATRLKAGEYRFADAASPAQVIARLERGDVYLRTVTFREGLTIRQMAALYERAGLGAASEFVEASRQADLIRGLDPAARNLEGYLFPDTYRFPRGTGEREIAAALVAGFRARWEREIRPLLAPGDHRGPRELVILASLVEKEARLDEERPLVAAVYANRLRLGIGLYADPTLIYGLKLAGRWDGDLRRRDLESDSPWNTYRVTGLPPGPICSAGAASLRAAARPADSPYLYFVSRNDGTHVFSTTLAEHNRNVEIWQRRYFRERAAAERESAALPRAH